MKNNSRKNSPHLKSNPLYYPNGNSIFRKRYRIPGKRPRTSAPFPSSFATTFLAFPDEGKRGFFCQRPRRLPRNPRSSRSCDAESRNWGKALCILVLETPPRRGAQNRFSACSARGPPSAPESSAFVPREACRLSSSTAPRAFASRLRSWSAKNATRPRSGRR